MESDLGAPKGGRKWERGDGGSQSVCVCMFKRSLNVYSFLTVPPSSSKILDEKGSQVEGTIGAFNERSTLILTCDVLGGKH